MDLAGVLMLGTDLARVQITLKRDAEERLLHLSEVVEAAGGMDKFLASISGDFREYYRDEGAYFPRHESFDHSSAEQSFGEMKDGINGLADNLGTVAQLMVATVESDKKTASMSLWVTYGGLLLIVAGFALQITAYL